MIFTIGTNTYDLTSYKENVFLIIKQYYFIESFKIIDTLYPSLYITSMADEIYNVDGNINMTFKNLADALNSRICLNDQECGDSRDIIFIHKHINYDKTVYDKKVFETI